MSPQEIYEAANAFEVASVLHRRAGRVLASLLAHHKAAQFRATARILLQA